MPLDFARPEGLVEVPICDLQSLGRGAGCTTTRSELFIDPAQPVTIIPGAIVSYGVTRPASAQMANTVPVYMDLSAALSLTTTQPIDPAWTVTRVAWLATGLCATSQNGQPLAVMRVPEDLQEATNVWRWAASSGLPVEPPACGSAAALLGLGSASSASAPAEPADRAQATAPAASASPVPGPGAASITYPSPGSTVNGPVQIIGTAVFDPGEVSFYKVEYGSGGNPAEWVTMGDVHTNQVSGGWLETWYAETLPAGRYALRVVLVMKDGNYLATLPTPVDVQH